MNKYYIPSKDADETSLPDLLQEVARHAKTRTAKQLTNIGVYPGQEKIFMLLAAEGAMSPGQLAARLNVQPPTITKTIIRLEEQGFVRRTSSEADRRQIVTSLTESGEALVAKIASATKDAHKDILSGLKKKERRQLTELLNTLHYHLLGVPPKKKASKKKK
ncbi:MAG: MarR family transcriptional regulator [Pseudomonadota bacterium]